MLSTACWLIHLLLFRNQHPNSLRLSCAGDFGPGPLDPHRVCETSIYAQPPCTHNSWCTHQLLIFFHEETAHLDL
ncbi:hypothetical protein BDZ91DRAFT_750200, partial [Kalaharituber pfeilii]